MVLEHLLTAQPSIWEPWQSVLAVPALPGSPAQGFGSRSIQQSRFGNWPAPLASCLPCHIINTAFLFLCWKQQQQQIIAQWKAGDATSWFLSSHTYLQSIIMSYIKWGNLQVFECFYFGSLQCSCVPAQAFGCMVWKTNFQNMAGLCSGTMPFDGRLSESTAPEWW